MTNGYQQPTNAADLHVHTRYSDGLLSVDQVLDEAVAAGLSVIAITDHDTIRGGYIARERAAQRNLPLEVIVGAEVNTLWGHLLALFIEDQVPSLRPVLWTTERVVKLGGLCIIPHPFSPWVPSVGRRALTKLMSGTAALPLSGAEVKGSRTSNAGDPLLTTLADIGGSDAHLKGQIGTCYTMFPGSTANNLREAIATRQTVFVSSARRRGLITPSEVVRSSWRALFHTPSQVARQVLGRPWKPPVRKESGMVSNKPVQR